MRAAFILAVDVSDGILLPLLYPRRYNYEQQRGKHVASP
jgi:hypothetical protein